MSSGDARFFSSTKKGEIAEWRAELNNPDKDVKKDAVKKCVAAMTVGKDVSMLFTDVVNCMQTDNVELKKLVYLYLINYSKTQPDLAILAVNTFVKVVSFLSAVSHASAKVQTQSTRFFLNSAGHARSEPPHSSTRSSNHGLYPREQNHRVPVRPSAENTFGGGTT